MAQELQGFSKPITVRLTESQWSVLEAMANVEGKAPSVVAREMISTTLDRGPMDREDSEVLSEVRKVGTLVAEFMTEVMLYIHGGDAEQAFGKVNEIFERARGNQKSDGRT